MKTFDKFMTTNEGKEKSNFLHKSLSTLLKSRDQVHYFHWQTELYSEHKAFNEYYDKILNLIDDLIETAQGQYGRIFGKIDFSLEDYNSDIILKHFDDTLKCIRECRSNIKNKALENIYDEIDALILKTMYILSLK